MGGTGGRAHLGVGGVRAAEADVGPGVGAEHHRVLRHQAQPRAHIGRVGIAQIHAVQPDRAAAARVVEPQQQLQHRRLAGAGRADQGHRLAGLDGQAEAVQRRLAWGGPGSGT